MTSSLKIALGTDTTQKFQVVMTTIPQLSQNQQL